MVNQDSQKHTYFNADKEINKYGLDHSTFDLVDVERFRTTRGWTVIQYLGTWFLMILSLVLLGSDIYTCVNILAFDRWSSTDYKPYAYSVAKWIFTGCILFQFLLLIYHWIWAIHTYKTKNIALAYVNSIARLLYIIKSYNYFCLFNAIEQDDFFDWASFLSYGEMDNALQILVADTPRQVINILTLRYYATDGDNSNDIISNIRNIAVTNLALSIILSFMCLSVVIWCIFFLKFVFGMILYVPVLVGIRKKNFKSLKKYCCSIVNDNVRILVYKNHKPKGELLEKGIVEYKDIAENPLLNQSTATFGSEFEYQQISKNIGRPSAIHTSNSFHGNNKQIQGFPTTLEQVYDSLPLENLDNSRYAQRNDKVNHSTTSLADPFSDAHKFSSTDHLIFTRSRSNDSSLSANSATSNRYSPPILPPLKNPFADVDQTISKHHNNSQLSLQKGRKRPPDFNNIVSSKNYWHTVDDAGSSNPVNPFLDQYKKANDTEYVAYKNESDIGKFEGKRLNNQLLYASSGNEEVDMNLSSEFPERSALLLPAEELPYPVRGVSMYENDFK